MILLGHGSGGRLSHQLIEEHFFKYFQNPILAQMDDSACLDDLAFTTDAYVVTPRFFPGGDIGKLSVCGTVNDLAMVGALPFALTASFILEEGLPFDELDRVLESMADTCREAGVSIVAGDTKIVQKGSADGIFITTSGIGRLTPEFRPGSSKAKPGDAIIISGSIADHGTAVLVHRENLKIKGKLTSDAAPLNGIVEKFIGANLSVHTMRDPTRGGLAQSLIEISSASKVRTVIEQSAIPIKPAVQGVCELLGLDPLYIANEGKLVLILPENEAQHALKILHDHPYGKEASIIGHVEEGTPACELITIVGTRRSLRMNSGELLPRIC